jgi:hypothetical protein
MQCVGIALVGKAICCAGSLIVVLALVADARAQSSVAGGIFGSTQAVKGRVSVAGDYRPRKSLPVFKNRSFCGASVADETLLIANGGALRNAAVLLRPAGGKAAIQPKPAVLDNKHCAFTPHIQVATLGSELVLKNSDPILHTVHARLGRETLFNVGLPRWRQVSKQLDRVGVIRIDCDVLHTWMSAAILVTDTPYFAVTDGAGRFDIDGVPAGAYDLEVWHERLGIQRIRLGVAEGTTRVIDVVYSAK